MSKYEIDKNKLYCVKITGHNNLSLFYTKVKVKALDISFVVLEDENGHQYIYSGCSIEIREF